MASIMGTVKNKIHDLWSASPDLKNVTFLLDGIGESSSATTNLVLLGSNGDPDQDAVSQFTQEWANFNHTRRYEYGMIPCAVIAQSGAVDQPTIQANAYVIFNACLIPFLSDTSLGGLVFTSEVDEGTSRTLVNTAGTAVFVPFTVTYWGQV
jgi:hypothetical protein